MSCNVVSPYNIVSIDPQNSYIIEVSTPGPQGPPGPSGSILNTGSFATTGSNTFRGNQIISGSVTISGSVLIISPNTFTNVGPAIFSGSVNIFSGSLTLTSGSFIADGNSSFTGSLFGTASFANSATSAVTASYAINFNPGATASYAATSSFLLGSGVGYFSGSFAGDGSQLINIPASSVIGLNLSQISSGSATASITPGTGFVVNTNAKITGSANIVNNLNAGYLLTNRHTFTGSVNITGSLAVNGVSFDAQTGAYLATWRYTSSLNTGADPGNGNFALNNVWSLAPTVASFDDFAYNPNVVFSSYLDSLGVGTVIKLISLSNSTTYKILQVTSTVPYQSGYEAYTVTQIASSGPDPNDGDQFAFIPVGSPGSGFDTISNPGPGRVLLSDGSTNTATASAQLLVTESVVRFATQSFDPTGSVAAGSIWFTSSSFYVGLE